MNNIHLPRARRHGAEAAAASSHRPSTRRRRRLTPFPRIARRHALLLVAGIAALSCIIVAVAVLVGHPSTAASVALQDHESDPRVPFFVAPRLRFFKRADDDDDDAEQRDHVPDDDEYKIVGHALYRPAETRPDLDRQEFEQFLLDVLQDASARGITIPDAHFRFSTLDIPEGPSLSERDSARLRGTMFMRSLPVFGYTTTRNHLTIPVPYMQHIRDARRGLRSGEGKGDGIPAAWEKKINKVVFRGALTAWRGSLYAVPTTATISDAPVDPGLPVRVPEGPVQVSFLRFRFGLAALGKPWSDIAFPDLDWAIHEDERELGVRLETRHPGAVDKLVRKDSRVDAAAYTRMLGEAKYLLALDGVTFAGRLAGLLRFGGVVVKNRSPFEDIATPLLHDGENHVLVKADASDFDSRVAALQHDDDRAHRIGTAGQKVWQEYLDEEGLRRYMRVLLRAIRPFHSPGLDGWVRV